MHAVASLAPAARHHTLFNFLFRFLLLAFHVLLLLLLFLLLLLLLLSPHLLRRICRCSNTRRQETCSRVRQSPLPSPHFTSSLSSFRFTVARCPFPESCLGGAYPSTCDDGTQVASTSWLQSGVQLSLMLSRMLGRISITAVAWRSSHAARAGSDVRTVQEWSFQVICSTIITTTTGPTPHPPPLPFLLLSHPHRHQFFCLQMLRLVFLCVVSRRGCNNSSNTGSVGQASAFTNRFSL